jgi:hypothetical protein
LFNENTRGILGIDVSYHEFEDTNFYYDEVGGNSLSHYDRYREHHVIISLDSELYDHYINPEYRVYKKLEGKGKFIASDDTSKEVIVASYNTIKNNIINTNTIYKFNFLDSIQYSPSRVLPDYWYNNSIQFGRYSYNIQAFSIRAKVSQIESDSLLNAIDKQFSFRYEVCIINETLGGYILYEVEKSLAHTRINSDTKTPEGYLRVKACDGYYINDLDIIELYTGRLTGRRTLFEKIQTSQEYVEHSPKNVVSYDFVTIVQPGYQQKEILNQGIFPILYIVKIRPLTPLPSSVDVQFYLESYYNETASDLYQYGVKYLKNGIDRAKYKSLNIANMSYNLARIENTEGISEFAFGPVDGIISETVSDIITTTKSIKTSNHELYPQYNAVPLYLRKGYMDTPITYIRKGDNSNYSRIDGIIANTEGSTWSIIPYSVNKKPVVYSFDINGTKAIKDSFDVDYLKNGRNISKMHEFGVYAPDVLNIADYYTDLKYDGRIAKSEGQIFTSMGVFEGISTIDGKQKRITQITEEKEDSVYRYINHAMDTIKKRVFGYAYDFVDRYNTFELPYYYIKSWWIPKKEYIKKGNDILLTMDYDNISSNNVGKSLSPSDYV